MASQYNLRAIRELIEAAFTADLIDVLAFDLFPKVFQKFSAGTSTAQKILAIVDFADRKGQIPELLSYISESNPYQYNIFVRKLGISASDEQLSTYPAPDFKDRRLASIYEVFKQGLDMLRKFEEELQTEKEREQKITPLSRSRQEASEASFGFSARRYGIGYDIQQIECSVNEDGSAIVRRSLTILAYSEISSLDTYLLVPEPPATGQEREVGFLNIKSLSPDREILITNQKKDFQRLSVELSFSPPLRDGDETRFQIEEKLPPGLFALNLNMQQIGQRETPYDYFGWNINRPTRHLRIQVLIPEDNKPKNYGTEVRYASASGFPADKIQFDEQKRVRNPSRIIKSGKCKLTLNVKYPMIGLIYIVRWEPKPIDA